MTVSAFARHLRLRDVSDQCEGTLRVTRWDFDAAVGDVRGLAVEVGRNYVTPQAALQFPRALVGPRVPTLARYIAGDFGEILSRAVYSARMGMDVPFNKLQTMRPAGNVTVQGPDILCLTLAPGGREPEPVTVEAKTRMSGKPSEILPAIGSGTRVQDEAYLVGAWAQAAESMLAHPDHDRQFALSAALHLGRLTDPKATLPPHAAHAVAIVGKDLITSAALKKYWGDAPPVSALHIVTVPNLEQLRSDVFSFARGLTFGDLSAGAASLLPTGLTASVSALISPQAAIELGASPARTDLLVVVEAALWFLADHDGIALARARHVAYSEDSAIAGLAQLLAGSLGGAMASLQGHALLDFAEIAAEVMRLSRGRDDLVAATQALAEVREISPDILYAAQHVAAAVIHRLDRHPATMTSAAGATGPAVKHVVDEMMQHGRYALWPSQAAALQGGLLDTAQCSVAIKMPTSAGKTALMQLLVADQLDKDSAAGVVVLAPTRALVAQLQHDLRASLPDSIEVRATRGGLDYDTASPSTAPTLTGPGATVVTPERFDLDWRRAATGDGGIDLAALKLIVVDEAQLIDTDTRGAALERVIARAMRRDIRVVLISSQFSDVAALSQWISGEVFQSEWQPAWMERLVYFRGPTGTKSAVAREGYMWSEGGVEQQILTLMPSEKSKGNGCVRDRKHETASLVQRYAADGLVVVFTDRKNQADGLLNVIRGRIALQQDVPADLDALAASIESHHPKEAADLRAGIGLHHADVPDDVKRAIETAARRNGGMLRCLVCTSTLLEGVDFPTRTVIAAYPPQDVRGQPLISRLHNLAGRAGRGGSFTSGRLVIMTSDHNQAHKWRKALRAKLPPTKTALTRALVELQNRQPDGLTGGEIIDALTIEVLAEAAVSDGDLRRALENALEQTMWSATSAPEVREPVMVAATYFARTVAGAVPDTLLRNAFYRSGLALQSCMALRNRLEPELDDITLQLYASGTSESSRDLLLYTLIEMLVGALDELAELRGIGSSDLAAVLTMWMAGQPESDIEAAHAEAWRAVKRRHLETVLPWALTGAFEVLAALAGDLGMRDTAHRNLIPARIRYGISYPDLFALVQQGADRVRVTQLAREVEADRAEQMQSKPQGEPLVWNLADAVGRRLAQTEVAGSA